MQTMMKDVALVPDCAFNLFCVSKCLKQGWRLGGTNNVLVVTSPSGNTKIMFDIKISMPNGVLYAICIKQRQDELAGVATTSCEVKKEVKMTLMQAHEKVGHINECATREISKVLGWTLTDMKALNCPSCAAGKAKQKSLKKVNFVEPDDEKDGYRAYLNLSTMKKNKNYPMPTNPDWQLMVVGMKLQLKISHF